MRRTSKLRGFTLVELMMVVAIVGVLATLAITGVRRYITQAATAEGKHSLGAISRGAQGAWERENTAAQVLGPGMVGTVISHALCGSSTAVPATVPKGVKYQPSAAAGADFNSGDSANGWMCLKFTIHGPIRYRYSYRQGSGYVATQNPALPSATGFEASGQADINATGVLSTIAITGDLDSTKQYLRTSTRIYVSNE